MNVSDQIIQVPDALCDKFGIAIDLTANNVIPQLEVLCEKFIRFEICTSIFWIVFVTVLFAVSWIVFITTRNGAVEKHYNDECLVVVVNMTAGVIGTFMIVLFFAVVGIQCYDIIQAINFPEKTVFEYVSGLLQ